jgi:hypothetical protein
VLKIPPIANLQTVTGWLDESKLIFEKTFTKPEVKCFKIWGTIFSQGHDECK